MPHSFTKLTPNLLVADVSRSLAFYRDVLGGTLTPFIHVTGIRELYAWFDGKAPVVFPLEKKWYGVTEFAISDPDGDLITFAEPEPA